MAAENSRDLALGILIVVGVCLIVAAVVTVARLTDRTIADVKALTVDVAPSSTPSPTLTDPCPPGNAYVDVVIDGALRHDLYLQGNSGKTYFENVRVRGCVAFPGSVR